MADAKTCDFCGAPMTWTAEQVALDVSLRLSGLNGLGECCDECDRRIVELTIAEEEEYRRRELDEELDDPYHE